MVWSAFHDRLAEQFSRSRITTPHGMIAAAAQPIELEEYFADLDDDDELRDESLSAFELLLGTSRYQMVLSLEWATGCGMQTLDLGVLLSDDDELFVVHQANDDAGTSLIIAHLRPSDQASLFAAFLADYLSSSGAAYQVALPQTPPSTIWMAPHSLIAHASVAADVLDLLSTPPAEIAERALGGGTMLALAPAPALSITQLAQPWESQQAA